MTESRTPTQVIEDLGIPTTSYNRAIQHITREMNPFSKEEYEKGYSDILGLESPVVFDTERHAHFFFLYTVQETLRVVLSGGIIVPENLADLVNERVRAYELEAPYSFKTYEEKVDEEGNVKPKKGQKGEKAKSIFLKEIMGKGLTRKQAIELLVEKADMTPAGGSTYFAKFKKEYGA